MKNTPIYILLFIASVSLCNKPTETQRELSSNISKCQGFLSLAVKRADICVNEKGKLFGKITNGHIMLVRKVISDLTHKDCRELFEKQSETCGKIVKKLHALNMTFKSEIQSRNEENGKELINEETFHKIKEETNRVHELNKSCTLRTYKPLYF